MQSITLQFRQQQITATRADGVSVTAACDAEAPALSANEHLSVALGSCIIASLLPILERHAIDPGLLQIDIAAIEELETGLDLAILLPSLEPALQLRLRRATERCPVKRALSVPVRLEWRTQP